MLRTARSMPTLKVFSSTIKKEVQQQTSAFSTVTTKYNLVVPNIPHNEHTLKYQSFTRSVHQTSKTNSTTLLSSKKSEFALMSLNSLKQECRKRGLKISGRKAELVSRITTYESGFNSTPSMAQSVSTSTRPTTSKSFSSTIPALKPSLKNTITKNFSKSKKIEAKGDTSHIDFIKPVDMEPTKLVPDDYIVQIPSISTEASAKPVTLLEKKLAAVNTVSEPLVVSKAEGSDIKIFEQGSFDHIEEQNQSAVDATINDLLNPKGAFEESSKEEVKDEPYEFDHSNIPEKDKKFWAGAFAVIGGLWTWNSLSKKKH